MRTCKWWCPSTRVFPFMASRGCILYLCRIVTDLHSTFQCKLFHLRSLIYVTLNFKINLQNRRDREYLLSASSEDLFGLPIAELKEKSWLSSLVHSCDWRKWIGVGSAISLSVFLEDPQDWNSWFAKFYHGECIWLLWQCCTSRCQ